MIFSLLMSGVGPGTADERELLEGIGLLQTSIHERYKGSAKPLLPPLSERSVACSDALVRSCCAVESTTYQGESSGTTELVNDDRLQVCTKFNIDKIVPYSASVVGAFNQKCWDTKSLQFETEEPLASKE